MTQEQRLNFKSEMHEPIQKKIESFRVNQILSRSAETCKKL